LIQFYLLSESNNKLFHADELTKNS